jgi:hypothetical protein
MSSPFTVMLYRSDDDDTQVVTSAALDIRPRTWSAIAKGGTWDADIDVFGPLAELTDITAWLGYKVNIINEFGTCVWWGDVQTVEIVAGGLRRGVTLDRLANRVMIRYSQKQPGGGSISTDTGWADNANSQTTYGVWERRIAATRELEGNEGTALRGTALSRLSQPHYTLAADRGAMQGRLYCTGYWQRTKRKYFSNLGGREQHNVSGAAYPLGLGIVASTELGFSARTSSIWHLTSKFTNFKTDMRVRLTGAVASGNNQTYTVTSANDDDAWDYQSSAVTFEAADDIRDANEGLGELGANDIIVITNSPINSGMKFVKSANAAAIEISPSFMGGNIEPESPGATIRFRRGNSIEVTPAPGNNEAIGTFTGTVTAWGQRYYQTFALSANVTNWTTDVIEIRLKRIGGPTDGVKVQLISDSAGSPGSVLQEATVDGDNISLDMDWVSFDIGSTSLFYGTTYGIVISRTGANDPDNYYEVDLDNKAQYAGGTCKAYDGAAYQTMSPACDLIFRVLGARDTGAQATWIFTDIGGFVTSDTPTTGIASNQYRDGELTAYDELEAILDLGNSSGTRLIARTTQGRAAIVTAKPDSATARYVLTDESQMVDLFGQAAEPGVLPAGEWVHLASTADLGPWAKLSPVFVERAEYSPGSGWKLEPEGAEDTFDMGARNG